ncbi:hypothetical protein M8494_29585 [Serratia ureilytica]
MWPGAAVSGWYFSHPEASTSRWRRSSAIRWKTTRRVGMSVSEVERWLAPNLGYDAD